MEQPLLVLELYVQGQGEQSNQAIARVRALGERSFGRTYRLTVIDVHEHDRVREAGIIVTPTLLRRWPEPVLRVVAPLTDDRIRRGMGLDE